jgi:hypothetical protein
MQNTISKPDLHQQWDDLKTSDGDSQARGYQLEQLLFELLRLEDLQPSPPYKSNGEQIDGFFEMDGRYFLVETKWQKEPVPASTVYAFRAKVDGKLIGTMGVFIAINGFSHDAPDALRRGKEINVLLFDGEDLEYALTTRYSFSDVLRAKLRHAAQYGAVDYAFKNYVKGDIIE